MLLLLAIADFANDEGEAWPSTKKLMLKCRSRKRAVQDAIYGLREAGELTAEPQLSGGYFFRISLTKKKTDAETRAPAQKPAPPTDAETCAGATQKPAPLHNDPSVDPSVKTSADSPHHQLVDYLCTAWKKVRGAKYPFTGRDAKNVQHLIDAVSDPQRIRAIMDAFLACQEAWLTSGGHTLAQLVGVLPKFVATTTDWVPEPDDYPRTLDRREIVADAI